jgi:hypothetical protein
MARTDPPLTPAELRRCAVALRLLAEHAGAEALRPENFARREYLEIKAQEAQELAAKCQRMAMAGRKG